MNESRKVGDLKSQTQQTGQTVPTASADPDRAQFMSIAELHCIVVCTVADNLEASNSWYSTIAKLVISRVVGCLVYTLRLHIVACPPYVYSGYYDYSTV